MENSFISCSDNAPTVIWLWPERDSDLNVAGPRINLDLWVYVRWSWLQAWKGGLENHL